jgi:hypothetical protein
VRTLMNTPDASYTAWFRQQAVSADIRFDSDCLNVVLAGTVYRECTCRLFIRALLRVDPRMRAKTKLHYLGLSSDLVRKEFAAAGLIANLVDHGFVKKDVAATAVKGGDILLSLVFDSAGNRASSAVLGLMTTKVFDYFLSGRPIVNVGPPDADVCVLASQIGYEEFHTFQSADEADLARFLEEALRDLGRFRERLASARLPDFAFEFGEVLAHVHA